MSIPVVLPAPAVSERALTPEQERYFFASQWRLIWWRLHRHQLAMVAFWFLVGLYGIIPFVELLAPYALRTRHPDYVFSPPQRIHVFHEGRLAWPFVYGHVMTLDMQTLKRHYREDRSRRYPLQFLTRGEEYLFWGLWRSDWHLVGVEDRKSVV